MAEWGIDAGNRMGRGRENIGLGKIRETDYTEIAIQGERRGVGKIFC